MGNTRLARRARLVCATWLALYGLGCDDGPPLTNIPRPEARDRDRSERDAASDAPGDAALTGDSGPAAPATCKDMPRSLGWPVAGERGVAWEVTHYFDLDPGPDVADFTGARGAAAKTYEGHPGVDISIADFRTMDDGIDVLAVAKGMVVDVVDGFFDRSKAIELPACNMVQNYIAIVEPETGYRHEYLHIRKGSARVRIGDVVKRGQAIALVGSAGCSLAPHVHLNVLDCERTPLDPFDRDLFEDAPSYAAELRVMDTLLLHGAISETDDIADPGAQAESLTAGESLGVGLVLSAGQQGDIVQLMVRRPDDSLFSTSGGMLGPVPRLSYVFWNVIPDGFEGVWSLEALHGERRLFRRELPVVFQGAKSQHLVVELSAADVADSLAAEAALNFQPRIIDGYLAGTEARFNIVFEAGGGRALRTNLDASAMAAERDSLAATGLAPVQVDAYGDGSNLRYAAVFAEAEDVVSYFGATEAEHDTRLAAQSQAGRVPISIAIADEAGTRRVAASYAPNANLTFRSWLGVDEGALDMHAASELENRRFPSHLHATDQRATQLYTVSFTSWDPGDHILARDLSSHELLTRHSAAEGAGFALVDLSATSTPEGVRYAALWLAQSRYAW